MTATLVIALLATVVLGVRLIRDLRPKGVDDGLQRWSQRYGLRITDDVHAWLTRRRRSTSLGYALGVWVGIIAGGIAVAHPARSWTFAGGFAVQAGWLVAGGIGAVIGGAIGARLTPADGPRVARSRAITLADYADPVERAIPVVAGVLALVMGFLPTLEGARSGPALSAAAAGAGGVVIVGIAEVLARITVDRPQRANGTHLLAWSDALRSETVRTSLAAAALIAAGSLVVSLPAALRAAGSPVDTGGAGLWTALALVALAAGLWIRSVRAQAERHFLRRLWPVTAAELAEHERPLEEAAR